MAILIERHEWRGVGHGDPDLFDKCFVLGWVSVWRRGKSIARELRTLRSENAKLRADNREWEKTADRALVQIGKRWAL